MPLPGTMTADPTAAPLAVIILAAGQGTRMKSDVHKVLHPIAGKPMLLHLLDTVAALAPAREIVVVGTGRDQVEGVIKPRGVATALQSEQRGTAHAVAAALPALSDTLLPAEAGDVLELDELWSFVGAKANARWVWVALCRQTRQIVAYFVGDRSAQSARALRERIPLDLSSKTWTRLWLFS